MPRKVERNHRIYEEKLKAIEKWQETQPDFREVPPEPDRAVEEYVAKNLRVPTQQKLPVGTISLSPKAVAKISDIMSDAPFAAVGVAFSNAVFNGGATTPEALKGEAVVFIASFVVSAVGRTIRRGIENSAAPKPNYLPQGSDVPQLPQR